MAMDSVLISHFLSFGKTGPAEIKNEVLLFVLGVAFGILVNNNQGLSLARVFNLNANEHFVLHEQVRQLEMWVADCNFSSVPSVEPPPLAGL